MFLENLQGDPEIHVGIQETENTQNSLEKEEHICGVHTFHVYYKAVVIKTVLS